MWCQALLECVVRQAGYLGNWCLLIHCCRFTTYIFLNAATCSALVWSTWKNSSAHRGDKMQDTAHPRDPACSLHDASDLWFHLLQLHLPQGSSAGLCVLPPQFYIPSVPERGHKQHSKFCWSLWGPPWRCWKTNVHPQQWEGKTTI